MSHSLAPKVPPIASHIFMVATQELKKGFLNIRGLMSMAAFLLVWGLILMYPVRQASSFIRQQGFRDLLSSVFGTQTLDKLFAWPVAELAVFWVLALYLFPLFTLVVAADVFSSDLSRKTLRFMVLRVSRTGLFLGRVLGQLLLQSVYMLAALLATLIMTLMRDASLLGEALSTTVLIYLNLLIIVLPYTTAMALLSLHANSARQASVLAVVFWTLLWIITSLGAYYFPGLGFLSWLMPGSQLSGMINSSAGAALTSAPLPLAQAALLLLLGHLYMQRRAL
ncbi:ABC transporter permease subunit [Shewanella cyperi]|uniref:ABC transporter permease subunit n=1 Tax=Shewanella cyperi TaxID=2814292 RepID=UPI001A951FB9|nr:ABC transporter permease subunit [Shewanella cyperi]QSX42275.1 ABC transporter [Shewanella cyperi]